MSAAQIPLFTQSTVVQPLRKKLRANEWSVGLIEHSDARNFIASNHYAQGAGGTSVMSFGLMLADQPTIFGAAVWLPPMRPAADWVARRYQVDPDRVLCLSRLAVSERVPTNGASFLMGRAIRHIRKERHWQALITWADTRLGHTGAIYRATNWEYTGSTQPRRLWVNGDGRLVSNRTGPPHARRSLSKDECQARGWRQTQPSSKHRFCMVLA